MSTVRPSAGTTYATSHWSPRAPLVDDGGRPGDVRLIGEHALDLAQLDPEPAHLHLEIGAAEVLDDAVLERQRATSPVTIMRASAASERVRGSCSAVSSGRFR